jgi:hypothetical protein
MKKVLLWMVIILGGLAAGVFVGLLLSTEQRLKLSQQLAVMIGGMVEQCPDG